MTVELRPLGVTCNIQCQYCYQNPQRDAGNLSARYDIGKMKEAVLAEGGPFSLFGGEALMVPLPDLEALFSWGLETYGQNSVQTNATLITDDHIRLFRTYKVAVGVSLDGPDDLNDARWNGTLERTREATRQAHDNLERLCRAGLTPSLIVTLCRTNATADKLPRMHRWVEWLHGLGIRSIRLHILESENALIRRKYGLSDAENIEAFLSFLPLERKLKGIRFDVFVDMRRMLRGDDKQATCVWTACDAYTTRAVRGVEGNGQRSNCGRTNKDGIDFVKSGSAGFERYIALYNTPEAEGGCGGCRFFLMCKGQCPGTAVDGDWRNKTEHCGVWKGLYAHFEREMARRGETPVSLDRRRTAIEAEFIKAWRAGRNSSMHQILARMEGRRAGPPSMDQLMRALDAIDEDLKSKAAEADSMAW